jgi:hypothetical protein
MQIFLPYSDFEKSLKVLDYKRLGKQRVEAHQIISAITNRPKLDGTPYKGWVNHPCTIMWRGYVDALKHYYNLSITEWISRGYNNTMSYEKITSKIIYPSFLGFDKFHASHRSNLLKKDAEFYSKYLWTESNKNPYVWLDENNNWYEQHSGEKSRVYF